MADQKKGRKVGRKRGKPTHKSQATRTKRNRVNSLTRHINKIIRGKKVHDNDRVAVAALDRISKTTVTRLV